MLRPFLVLICAALLVVPAAQAAGKEQIRIGVVVPLSGTSASLGTYIKNGIELAYDSLPTETKERVELIFEDDGWRTSNAVSAFQKLVKLTTVFSWLGRCLNCVNMQTNLYSLVCIFFLGHRGLRN